MSLPPNGRVVDVNKGGASAEGGLFLGNDIWIFTHAGTPSDGTSGTGFGVAGPGSVCLSSTTKKSYINTNTKASPTWTVMGTQT